MPSGWTWSGLTIPDLVKAIEASVGNPMTLLISPTSRIRG